MVGLVIENHDGRPFVEVLKDPAGESVGAFLSLVHDDIAPAAFLMRRFGGETVPVGDQDLPGIDERTELRGDEIEFVVIIAFRIVGA
ncbi:MAG: hypothetical protein A4E66_01847 [Syntrophus sp. PtaB.Bin001]|nr:MAG: hypothetical protein A4E66_01847 [Syntrophus sp. PtaB.Bin001]